MPGHAAHRRRSIRLHDYDYSATGAYFITICTQGRACLFGEVVDGAMCLNGTGAMIESVWNLLPQRYPGITLDAFVVMPNHIHGIVSIDGPVGAIHELPLHQRRSMTLPKVVGYLKMNSAKRINQSRNTPGIRVWQRNYYERVIRDN